MSFVFLEVDGESLLILERPEADVVFVEPDPVFVSFAERGPPGASDALPGGTTGQLRAKASDTDFDEEWIDPPTSGVWGQIEGDLTSQSDVMAAFASARLFAAIF